MVVGAGIGVSWLNGEPPRRVLGVTSVDSDAENSIDSAWFFFVWRVSC